MVPWHYCGIVIKLGIKSINQSMCRSMGFSHGATSVKQTFLCNNFSYRTRCNKCRSLVLVPWKIMRTVKGQKDSVVRADHGSHVCRTCDRSFFFLPFRNWFQRFRVSESRDFLDHVLIG